MPLDRYDTDLLGLALSALNDAWAETSIAGYPGEEIRALIDAAIVSLTEAYELAETNEMLPEGL